MENQNKSTSTAAIILFFIQCLTLIGFIKKQDYDRISGLVIITVLFLLYSFLKIKFNLYMKHYITWIVIITIVGHNLVGEYLGLYVTSFVYDKVLHVFGTYGFSLFFYSIIAQLLQAPTHVKVRELILIILLGTTLGAVFEIIEFIGDITLKPVIPNQTNLFDTDIDMIADLIGASIAGFHGYLTNFSMLSHS